LRADQPPNIRARKKGANGVAIEELYSFSCTGADYVNKYKGRASNPAGVVDVTVVGILVPVAKIGGYSLVGVIDHTWDWTVDVLDVDEYQRVAAYVVDHQCTKSRGSDNMVTMFSEDHQAKDDYFKGYHCDYCNIDRIRNHTLIIEDPDGNPILFDQHV